MAEFLVTFEINLPDGTPESEVTDRESAEAEAAAELVAAGHLLRLWRRRTGSGATTTIGLYRADTEAELNGLLDVLPLRDWMQVGVTPLEPHPNDPLTPH
jgi:muconolactone delta-isomerase